MPGRQIRPGCFAGTHEAITMDVRAVSDNPNMGTDADGNVIQPGLYTVNYKNKIYKEAAPSAAWKKCWPLRSSATVRRRMGP